MLPKTKLYLMKFDKILCRYGELALKASYTRSVFENKLISNINKGLKSEKIKFKIEREPGRIFIKTREIKKSCKILRRIFGLTSISPVKEVIVKADIKKLGRAGENFAKDYIRKDDRFAIRAKRTGNDAFTSKMIERKLGSKVVKEIGAGVDLDNPDKILFVEVRQNKAYFFKEKIECPGGLPLGTQGKVLVLLSGGIDSAVAAWMLMKRGCKVAPLYFKVLDGLNKKRVKSVLKDLKKWSIGYKMKLVEISYKEILNKISEKCNSKFTCLVCKRMMYRIAEKIAAKKKAKVIVTGENLGQVASQTLENINVLDRSVEMPIFRPLIGHNKNEIIELAKKIGTYESSIMSHNRCKYIPESPRTKGRIKEVLREEEKIDIEKLIKKAIKKL